MLFLGCMRRRKGKGKGVGCCIYSVSQSFQILVFNYQEEQNIATVLPTVTSVLGWTLGERQSDLITQPMKRLNQ